MASNGLKFGISAGVFLFALVAMILLISWGSRNKKSTGYNVLFVLMLLLLLGMGIYVIVVMVNHFAVEQAYGGIQSAMP